MRLQELQQREVEILLLSCSGASLGFSFLALLVSAVFFWGFPCFPAPAFSPALPPSITLSIRPPASPPSIPPSLHPSLKENGSRIQSRARNIRDPAWLETKKKRQGYKKCDKTTPAASFVPRGILRVTFNHFCSARRLARLSFLIFNICLNVCFFTRHAQRPHSNIRELLQLLYLYWLMDYSLTLLLPSTASPLPLLHYLTALPPSPPPSASPPFLSSSTFLLLSLCCIIFHNCEAFSRLSHPETLAHTRRHLFPRVLHLLTFTYPVGVVVLFHHRPTSHSYIYQTTLGKNKKKPPATPRLLVSSCTAGWWRLSQLNTWCDAVMHSVCLNEQKEA